ncbi:MAG TPA: cation:proton antiporter [Deferrisomatales bacterium]|nr:cation:proton antiporter [Deferrisomatales bacterium]
MTQAHNVLFAVVAGAAAMPFISRRLRCPAAVLELLFGTLLFQGLLHGVPPWFGLLQEIGFIYLMFLAGMELDLRALLRGRALWHHLALVTPPFAVLPLLLWEVGWPPFLGVAVATCSAGIVLPVLKEAGLQRGALGQQIIGASLTGEVVSIAVLTAADTVYRHGLGPQAWLQALELLGLGLLGYLALKILYALSWWHAERVDKVMESDDPTEEGIRVVIAVAFAGALLAHLAGAEPILGAFVAGAVFSYVFPNKGRFEEKVNAVGFGFFTPFFFMGVGAQLDPALLLSPELLLRAGVLSLLLFAGRLLPVLFRRRLGLRPVEAWGMALLLSAPLSMLVVAGTLGERMGMLDAADAGALVVAAVASSIVYPYVFRRLGPRLAPVPGG